MPVCNTFIAPVKASTVSSCCPIGNEASSSSNTSMLLQPSTMYILRSSANLEANSARYTFDPVDFIASYLNLLNISRFL